MEDLILYLCTPLHDPYLALTPEEIEVGSLIIGVAVPLMFIACLLGFFAFACLSAFNLLRGRKRDI